MLMSTDHQGSGYTAVPNGHGRDASRLSWRRVSKQAWVNERAGQRQWTTARVKPRPRSINSMMGTLMAIRMTERAAIWGPVWSSV